MPRKASPLSSTSIGNFAWSYIFIRHMICVFAWSVLYDLSLYFLVYHNHPCCTHLLREPYMIWNLLEFSMCFAYIFWVILAHMPVHCNREIFLWRSNGRDNWCLHQKDPHSGAIERGVVVFSWVMFVPWDLDSGGVSRPGGNHPTRAFFSLGSASV